MHPRLAVLVIAATFVGCGGRTANQAGADAADGAVVACTAEATAHCARLETCYANALSSDYGDVATCQSRRKLSCLAGLDAKGDFHHRVRRGELRDGNQRRELRKSARWLPHAYRLRLSIWARCCRGRVLL